MKIFLLLCLIPFCLSAEELKIMTWNTFLLPPPWNKTKQVERANAMKKALPELGMDIMFFQEAFFDKQRKNIITELKKTHPYIAVPKKGKKVIQFQDSGLFIASVYPIEVLDQVIFKDCTKSDCLASKSAILVELTLPSGRRVQMINTHLQAWNDAKTIAVRKKQFQQIKVMMAEHEQENIPQILVGDLNIDGNTEDEYSSSLELMGMTSTQLVGPLRSSHGFDNDGCFNRTDKDGQEWLDHVWLKTNGSEAVVTEKKVVPIMGMLEVGECPLSDHYSVQAIVTL